MEVRCREGRIVCNPEHVDYRARSPRRLDMLAACRWDPGRAAIRLECTPTQLVRLLKDHPPAARLNAERESQGKHGML